MTHETCPQEAGRPRPAPFPAVLALALALLLSWTVPALAADPNPFARSFGTVSLRRPMTVFPFWLKVMEKNRKNDIFVSGRHFRGKTTWDSFERSASGLGGMELLRFVNRFWNTFPYIEDINNWGRADYWAAPYEFLKKSGDCEDYAIVKYFTLRRLGYAADDMRIFVVKDTFRGLPHAVLGVNVNGTVYILDNVSNAILSQSRLVQYAPQYSLNEDNAWMHMQPKKNKKRKK